MVAASLAARAVASSRSMKISADIRASLGERPILGPMFPCRCDGHHKMSCGRAAPTSLTVRRMAPILRRLRLHQRPQRRDQRRQLRYQRDHLGIVRSGHPAYLPRTRRRGEVTPDQRAPTPQRWRAKPPQTLPGRPPLRGATNKSPRHRGAGAKSRPSGLPSCDARQTHRGNTTAGCTARRMTAQKSPASGVSGAGANGVHCVLP